MQEQMTGLTTWGAHVIRVCAALYYIPPEAVRRLSYIVMHSLPHYTDANWEVVEMRRGC